MAWTCPLESLCYLWLSDEVYLIKECGGACKEKVGRTI